MGTPDGDVMQGESLEFGALIRGIANTGRQSNGGVYKALKGYQAG